jgi:hypothetical protein
LSPLSYPDRGSIASGSPIRVSTGVTAPKLIGLPRSRWMQASLAGMFRALNELLS